jgi:transcriptional regulator with XRE-family HTH domain
MAKSSSRKERVIAIAGKLREAREHAGFSQEEAAKRLHRPQSYISRCETGVHPVNVFELEDFARLYRKALLFFIEE